MTSRQRNLNRRNKSRKQKRERRKEIATGIAGSVITMLLLVGFVIILFLGEANRQARYSFQEITMYNVSKGDTLWEIAQEVRTSNRQDIRQIVFLIVEMNNFDGSVLIRAGDVIAIPVFDNETPRPN